MGHGGKRPGAGRKPGAVQIRSLEDAARILGDGVTPLDYLVGVMRGTEMFDPERFEAAKAAAPYMHARLAAVEHKGEVAVRNVARLPMPAKTAKEWSSQHSPSLTH